MSFKKFTSAQSSSSQGKQADKPKEAPVKQTDKAPAEAATKPKS